MNSLTPVNPKKRKPSSPYMAQIANSLSDDCSVLFTELQGILEEKAPEAVPLLEKLVGLLTPNPSEIVAAEKRARSIVITGIPEDPNLSATKRQAATELAVSAILDELDVEARPVEIFRLGKREPGKNRLVKCVFSSRKQFFEILKNSRLLRNNPSFKDIFIRRSMTPSEIENERKLRARAKELNDANPGGERIFVVFRQQVVKKSEIPGIINMKKDRVNKRGGGLCVFLHQYIDFKEVPFDPPNIPADVLCFDMLSDSCKYIRFLLIYRPPNQSAVDDDRLCCLISDLCSSISNVVLLGDLNLDIDWSKTEAPLPLPRKPRFSRFTSLFSSLNLQQNVLEPTCGSTILDVILTSPELFATPSIIPPLGASDHNVIKCRIEIPINIKDSAVKVSWRDYPRANAVEINNVLDKIDWFSVFDRYISIDDVYDRFLSIVHTIIERYVPIRKQVSLWETYPRHIRNLYEYRERLFQILDDPLTSSEYKKANSDFTFHLKRYLAYKERKLANCQNMKGLFSYVSKRLGKKYSVPCVYNSSGNVLISASDRANALADYFASVFDSPEENTSSLPPIVDSECPLPIITPSKVYKYLRCAKNSSSIPSDGVPAIFYKMFARKLAAPICHLLNISLLTGEVPRYWRESIVTAIPKKPSASSPGDFRPISLTPTPCKVMEKFLKSCFLEWFEKFNLIPPEQFGFVKNSSTCLQLLECTHNSDCCNFSDASVLLDSVVDRMTQWTSDWGLRLNIHKTCLLSLGKRSVRLTLNGLPSSTALTQSRDLGVIVSKSLCWEAHIDAIVAKALKRLYCFIRLRELCMKSLLYRRTFSDIVLAFKILKGESCFRPSSFWCFKPSSIRRPSYNISIYRANHGLRLQNTIARNSFFYRTSTWLNKLPLELFEKRKTSHFKKALLGIDFMRMIGVQDF
ncbi:hypothetical protein OSTOST_25307 [Ostertagia ostertagi]